MGFAIWDWAHEPVGMSPAAAFSGGWPVTANRIVSILAIAWLAMIAMSFVHPLLATPDGGEFQRHLGRLIYFFAWQGFALFPAMGVLVVRMVSREQLSGPSVWMGWVPPVGSLLGIVALAMFGHLAG